MTPNSLTGLVSVTDRGAKNPDVPIKMWPVDVKETFIRGGDLKDGKPRFVLTENYVAPDPA